MRLANRLVQTPRSVHRSPRCVVEQDFALRLGSPWTNCGTIGERGIPWLDGASIELNPGLVAIIGHKGSGKSALTDALALVTDADVEAHLSFLSSARFRNVRTGGAREFSLYCHLALGDTESRLLNESVDQQRAERIRYLPQNYFEKLCSDVGEEAYAEFERELKRVVFSWLPEDRQLGKSTLDDLINALTTEWRERRRLVSRDIAELNREIAELERALQPSAVRERKELLADRRRELEAHNSSKPEQPPSEEPTKDSADGDVLARIDAIGQSLEVLAQQRTAATGTLTELRLDDQAAAAIKRRLDNVQYYVQQQLNEADAETELARLRRLGLFHCSPRSLSRAHRQNCSRGHVAVAEDGEYLGPRGEAFY